MDRIEPRSANDYDDRTTAAVKRVLVEIGQILGSFEGKFAVIGGAVRWRSRMLALTNKPGHRRQVLSLYRRREGRRAHLQCAHHLGEWVA